MGRELGGLLTPIPSQKGLGSDVEHGCPQGVAPGVGAISVQLFANPRQLAGCVVQRALAEALPCRDRHQAGLEALQPGERAFGTERQLPVAQSGGQPPGQQVLPRQRQGHAASLGLPANLVGDLQECAPHPGFVARPGTSGLHGEAACAVTLARKLVVACDGLRGMPSCACTKRVGR